MFATPEDMRNVAKGMEEQFHSRGWDLLPMLGYVYRAPGLGITPPPGMRLSTFMVVPFERQPHEVDQDVAQGLLRLASVLLYMATPPQLIPREMIRDFAGLIFVSEGWEAPFRSPEERDADKRRAADIPGAYELRCAMILDCSGRVHQAMRVRGEPPVVQTHEPGTDMSGSVIVALRDLMRAIGKQLPFGSMDLDAVAAIAREDVP